MKPNGRLSYLFDSQCGTVDRPKKPFNTRAEAEAAARSMTFKEREPFLPYTCLVCGKYHVGHVRQLKTS